MSLDHETLEARAARAEELSAEADGLRVLSFRARLLALDVEELTGNAGAPAFLVSLTRDARDLASNLESVAARRQEAADALRATLGAET